MNNGTQWMYIREDRELYQHCNFKVFSRKMNHVVSRDRQAVSSFLRDKLTTSPVQGKSEIDLYS